MRNNNLYSKDLWNTYPFNWQKFHVWKKSAATVNPANMNIIDMRKAVEAQLRGVV